MFVTRRELMIVTFIRAPIARRVQSRPHRVDVSRHLHTKTLGYFPTDSYRESGVRQQIVRLHFSQSRKLHFSGIEPLGGRLNYFFGNDPKRWVKNVPRFAGLVARDVWAGIDMTWYGNNGVLETDLS